MTDRKDFTRWNRAGLHRLTYVDGNAPLFLDHLRAALKDRFPNRAWAELPVPQGDVDAVEPEVAQYQRNRKIIEQYHGERRDPGWEIARTVSRSCHVLTGHVDAHANEAFIRTATQWDNLRRLVETIDYHPAAATSASTELVLLAKPGRKGTVKKGFQVKYTPPEGGPTVIFETLDDLEIDPDLNELRPAGWNSSEGPVASADGDEGTAPNNGDGPSESEGGGAPAPATEPEYSAIALGPARHIQGVGPERSKALDSLTGGAEDSFRIKDFLALDPANPGLAEENAIPETWLRELRAKAIALATCELDPGWTTMIGWPLSSIAAMPSETLAKQAGRTLEEADALKLRVELLATYLNHEVYVESRLKDVFAPVVEEAPVEVKTFWRQPKKPQVKPGQVAMVFDEDKQVGEAVTIARIDDGEQGESDG